jgi:hypothetical protein
LRFKGCLSRACRDARAFRERHFRRIISYRDLAKLVVAIEYELTRTIAHTPTQEAATLISA